MALTIPNRLATGHTVDAGQHNSNYDAISAWATTTDADIATLTATSATHTSQITALGSPAAVASFYAFLAAPQTISSATTYTTIMVDDTGSGAFDQSSKFTVATALYQPAVAGAYHFDVNVALTQAGLTYGEVAKVFLTKNSSPRYELITFGNAAVTPVHFSGSGSMLLKANGTTDTFSIQIWVSAGTNTVVDRAYFCGHLVAAD